MTSGEVIDVLRMQLDDGLLRHTGKTEALRSINEAQRALLRLFYRSGNERALRPLYRVTALLDNGDSVPGVEYPRACRIYNSETDPDATSWSAVHVKHELFLHYAGAGHGVGADFTPSPQALYCWHNNQLFFVKAGADQRAKFWYVKAPETFTESVTLELPAEFHMRIASYAAELLNEADEGELEREGLAATGRLEESRL